MTAIPMPIARVVESWRRDGGDVVAAATKRSGEARIADNRPVLERHAARERGRAHSGKLFLQGF